MGKKVSLIKSIFMAAIPWAVPKKDSAQKTGIVKFDIPLKPGTGLN